MYQHTVNGIYIMGQVEVIYRLKATTQSSIIFHSKIMIIIKILSLLGLSKLI